MRGGRKENGFIQGFVTIVNTEKKKNAPKLTTECELLFILGIQDSFLHYALEPALNFFSLCFSSTFILVVVVVVVGLI
jgi:hypothetical protein